MTRPRASDMTHQRTPGTVGPTLVRLRLRLLPSGCRGTRRLRRGRPRASYGLGFGDVSLGHVCGALFRVRTLTRAITLALEGDVVRGVHEPVKRALGEHGIREERVPLRRWSVAGHDGRAAPHALADELVQVLA